MPRRASVTKEQVQAHPAIAGGHVILMSGEAPAFPEAATFQGNDAMQQSLENQGLEYEPTRGKYGKPENSFIVHVNDPSHIEAALGMAKRFGQESVVYSTGGKHQLVWTNGPHEGQATQPSEGHDFYDAEPEDNYTMIPGPNGEPHGFMAYHLDFNNPPAPFNPSGGGTVTPPEAAKAVVKAAVEAYEDILLGLRSRELAKAATKSEKTMKLTDLIKSQIAKAPEANGGAITHAKTETCPNCGDHGPRAGCKECKGTGKTTIKRHKGPRPSPEESALDEGRWNPMDTEKAEKGNHGGHCCGGSYVHDGKFHDTDCPSRGKRSNEQGEHGHGPKKPAYQPGDENKKAESERVLGILVGAEGLKKALHPGGISTWTQNGTNNHGHPIFSHPSGWSVTGMNKTPNSANPPGIPDFWHGHNAATGQEEHGNDARTLMGAIDFKHHAEPVVKASLWEKVKAVVQPPTPAAPNFVNHGDYTEQTAWEHPKGGKVSHVNMKTGPYAGKPMFVSTGPRGEQAHHDSHLEAVQHVTRQHEARKSEVNVNKGNLKANGGKVTRHSIWKKAEVASAPEANGGDIVVGKKELVSAGNRKANGGTIVRKQEWVIDLKATGHDEERVIEKDPVKGAKGFEKPKKQDRPEESSATGGSIKGNDPKKGPKQGPAGPDILKPETSPGGKQDAAVSVKGKGDAKGGGTDIFDSVKGKRSPAKDPVIEKGEGSFGREESSSRGEMTSDDEKVCPACGGESHLGGVLGDRKHFNCHGCGMWFSHKPGSDTAKAEGIMKAPAAAGAAGGGSPHLGAASGGTSPPRMGLPQASPGAKPQATHAMSEKKDISGKPTSPSAGPAGNTAITSVDTKVGTWHGKSEASTIIFTSLKKAFGEPPARSGREPLPGAPAGTTGVAAKLATPARSGREPLPGAPAGTTGVAAKLATAAVSKPMGVPAASAAPAKPAGLASPAKARTPQQDIGSILNAPTPKLKIPVPAAKKEIVSAPPANGGTITRKEEKKDRPHYNSWAEAAEANSKRVIGQDHRTRAGLPSAEETLFEESDPKVLHPSDKKTTTTTKKAELCKGCGKTHKSDSCAA
jgi:hypothetical protein